MPIKQNNKSTDDKYHDAIILNKYDIHNTFSKYFFNYF